MATTFIIERHVERDKSNKSDPQTPTAGGEVAAYTMGMELRKVLEARGIVIDRRVSSPQDRASRTSTLTMRGVAGFNGDFVLPPMRLDVGLNDFSSDKRPIVVNAMAQAKAYAAEHGVEIEEAIFKAGGDCPEALTLKVREFSDVIKAEAKQGGVVLITCHGAVIDAVIAAAHKRFLNEEIVDMPGPDDNGGLLDKVEGAIFVTDTDIATVTDFEYLRQPQYLKNMNLV